ncbi:hypothetical protein Vretifemale_17458 [Volvox reticuliferus]|uniref:THUMP domain-containing protein n=1 Tax=Volvox reticuliferus TaxID=1737510 RepID=A0A8J4CVU2_9CHLO|nr:hypothetical protein Vretifemale_17458 [Volvox reticuliferus]
MSDQGEKKRKYGGRGGGGGRGGRGDGGESGDKRNKRTKYFQVKRGTGQAIPLNSQGILVTCDAGREERGAGEAVILIEEHYDSLTDPSAKAEEKGAAVAAADSDKANGKADGVDVGGEGNGSRDGGDDACGGGGAGKDIAALLAEEVAQLKDKKAARFQVHDTGVKGCMFVVFPSDPQPGAPGPVEVVRSIALEAKEKKQVRGRHLVRLLPVTHSCFAGLDQIRTVAPKIVAPHFPEGEDATPVEFSVEYEHRSADGFDRMEVINAFTAAIKTPPHKVNLTSPSASVLVQLIRNGCAMAVVPGYRELARFNLRRLAEVETA